MSNTTTEQVGKPHPNGELPNPNGKGGFADHPENINAGGRPKNAESFAYWYTQFKNMSVTELKEWIEKNPEDTRTVAADLAYRRVFNSQKDLKEFQEVADRSEGKPKQSIDMNMDTKISIVTVKFVGEDATNADRKPDRDTDRVS